MRGRLTVATLLAILAVTMATACADDNTPGVASMGPASSSAGGPGPDAFSRCMRDNGVDLDDGAFVSDDFNNASGWVEQTQPPDLQRRQHEALEKCRQYLPDGGNPQPMSAEELDRARAIAKCMREAGVDYPDPEPNALGGPGAMQVPPGVDISDPRVRTLLRECVREAGAGAMTPGGSS